MVRMMSPVMDCGCAACGFWTRHGHAGAFDCRLNGWLGRVERTDGDVVPVRISKRKLRGSSVEIHMWLFFQPADESARPWQSYVKVVDPEEQEEAVSRLGVVRAGLRRMLVGTPRVKTEQYRSIRVEDLPEVVVGRSRLRQAK